ncbi:MAG: type I restriction endonuclease [Gordonibacter pamelaeae]
MHQVHYKDGNNSIDCVMLINGIPVATMEVKTELTQTVETAIEQYRNDRKPVDPYTNRKHPLLMYKRGAVVHFAVSENEIYMCTNLGDGTDKDFRPRFLPFNMGNDGHAGNPDAPEGSYRVPTSGTHHAPRPLALHLRQVRLGDRQQTGLRYGTLARDAHADLPALPPVRMRAQGHGGPAEKRRRHQLPHRAQRGLRQDGNHHLDRIRPRPHAR